MKVYLASPFFNDEENKYYEKMIKMLRDEGHKVFVPKEHEIPNAWDLPNDLWGESVFAVDILGIQKCDVVVVLNHGMYSDSGTAWECGYAYALGKDVVNVLCGEGNFSLMMLNGCNTYIKFDDFSKWFLEHLVQGKNIRPDIEQK